VNAIAAKADANGVVAATPLSLVGHIGHLDAQQTKLFEEFRASQAALHAETEEYLTGLDRARIAAKEGREATAEELAALSAAREAEWPYELARFLRANKWKLPEARKGYEAYLAWRKLNKVDTVLDTFPFHSLLLDRAVGNNASGFDKRGRPLYFELSGSVFTDGLLTCFTDDDVVRAHLWQQETSTARAAASSAARGEHIETFTNVLDLANLSSTTQRAIKFTKSLSAVDSAYYPERLADLYVVNAPWIFAIMWKLVRGWLDPVTANKIHIIKGDPKPTLLAHIDADQLPAAYGGTCDRCLNSPQCAKQFSVAEFAELLPLKMDDAELIAQMKRETIKAGKVLKESVPMAAGEVVEWVWQNHGKVGDDIDWTVTFTPSEGAAAEPIVVVQECRVQNTGLFMPQCSYRSTVAGTLHLEWSNKFSWLASKQISFLTRKIAERRDCLGDLALAFKVAKERPLGPQGSAAAAAEEAKKKHAPAAASS